MIGNKIRDLRKKLGLTQEQLAGTELTKSYVSQVELGRIRPSKKALQMMATRLSKPLGYFLDNDDDLRTVDVLLRASDALWGSGRLDEASIGLREARHLAERIGRDDLLAKIESTMGRLELSRHRFSEATTHLQEALDLLSMKEFPVEWVKTSTTMARATAAGGQFHEAVAWFHQSSTCSRSIAPDHPEVASEAIAAYADFCRDHQEWSSASVLYEEALATLNGATVPWAIDIQVQLVAAWIPLGRFDEAKSLLDTIYPVVQELPKSSHRITLSLALASSALDLTHFTVAYALLEQVLRDSESDEALSLRCVELGLALVRLSHEYGWLDAFQTRAMKFGPSSAAGRVQAESYCVEALFAKDHGEAFSFIKKARQLRPEDVHIAQHYGLLALKTGHADAWDVLSEALGSFSKTPIYD